jgi:iron complex outermembrane receptor protein
MKMKYKKLPGTVVASTLWGLGAGFATSASAQDANPNGTLAVEEIIVNARRVEERLQDVPISVAVFNQEQLSKANVTNVTDLALYTPSLQANTRWGTDQASFSIRGFAQEQRTSASVATYFGEVVTPRGGPTQNGGDGAGPGALFDLQNVQVLNGPQGTLFGRNTTGGAVVLVPNKPTDELGGYLEVSGGDYELRRVQGVFNLPLSEAVRLRVGADIHERDGYLKNLSPVGPDNFGNIDYQSYRASLAADLTPNLENYTIGTYTHSETNGSLQRILACTNNTVGAQLGAAQACTNAGLPGNIPTNGSAAFNRDGFYDVWNSVEEPNFESEVWQVQNITTWDVTDNLRIRNVASYAELIQANRGDVNGTYMTVAGRAGTPFATSGLGEAYDTTRQDTLSEEIQLQGRAFDSRLSWQAGVYYEESGPLGLSGSLSQTLYRCDNSPGSDPLLWTGCTGLGSARATLNQGSINYQNKAVYAQGDYNFTDKLTLTAGVRYTRDRTEGVGRQFRWTGNNLDGDPGDIDVQECAPTVTALGITVAQNCELRQHVESSAPTWTAGLDYHLTDDAMVYAKYSRGYRQASVNPFGPPSLQTFDEEQVDAYELGTKTTFNGALPSVVNVALFYNDLSDAQLQTGFVPPGSSPTIAIINADGVTTYGAELSAVVQLFDAFEVSVAYSYLQTNVDKAPLLPAGANPTTVYFTDQDLFNSPENKVTVGANYRLPLPGSIGDVSFGATYSYVAEQLISVVSDDGFNNLPSYKVVNVNLNWQRMFGAPLDSTVFVTNALDEEYNVFQSGVSTFLNFEAASPAPPRMVGVRLRYRFGGEK